MVREDERNGNWFAVESKSFEFKMEGEGKKINCFITERSRGIASWIRFGGEGMIKLLAGVEECSRVFDSARKPFEWKENDRYYRLESKVNRAGRFLLCSVTDVEGKRHRLIFPEGRGILNGWNLLVDKIRGLGFKAVQECKPMRSATKELLRGAKEEWTSVSKKKQSYRGGTAKTQGRGRNRKQWGQCGVDGRWRLRIWEGDEVLAVLFGWKLEVKTEALS